MVVGAQQCAARVHQQSYSLNQCNATIQVRTLRVPGGAPIRDCVRNQDVQPRVVVGCESDPRCVWCSRGVCAVVCAGAGSSAVRGKAGRGRVAGGEAEWRCGRVR